MANKRDIKFIKPSLADRLKYIFTGNSRWLTKNYEIGKFLPDWKVDNPVFTSWNTENAIKEGFKVCSYVYSCIHKKMKAASSVPWIVEKRTGDDEWEKVTDHPLVALMEEPNPFMDMGTLVELITAHLNLGGNAILQLIPKTKDGNTIPAEMWPIMPDNIKPVPNREDFIGYYEFHNSSAGIKKRLEVEEIIHFYFPDPSNVYWGMSPLMAGARTVDTDVEAQKWNKLAMENRAVTDGVFSVKEDLSESQYDELKALVKEQHQGSAAARMPWILSNGAQWQQMSLSPVEMDYIETRKFNREDVCSLFDVPPPLIGFYEQATLNNIKTARRIFWEDTNIPYLDDIKKVFNLNFQQIYGKDIRVNYDISGVPALREDFNKKVENAKQIWTMGVPFNKINQRLELGFEEVEGGDVGYIPGGVLPVSGGAQQGKAISNLEDLDKKLKDLKKKAE